MSEFSALYQDYAPDVYRFALYLSGRHADAEDITAETFARLWASSEPIAMATVKGYDALDEDLRDPSAGPERQAEHSESLRQVLKELQRLPETSRSALLMRAVDGIAYEEIARALGISLAAVKVKIHRARLALVGLRDA